jgi:hypothetical protein
MTDKRKAQIWYSIALVFTTWFVLTCAIWTYLVNVLFSFPAGLVGFAFWYIGRKYDKTIRLGRIVVWMLRFGVCFSLTTFLLFYFFG